jgi:hypothetical protein
METKHIVDSIYDKLVLRDLIGKVVPGSVSMLSVAIGLYGPDDVNRLLSELHWSLLVIGAGVAWLMGFALQFTGETLGLLKTHPGPSRRDFFSKWAEFHATATDHQKIHAERLNVIKEACGNGSVAFIGGSVIIAVAQSIRGVYKVVPMCILLTLAVFVGVALWRMHITHVERYGDLVANTLGLKLKEQADIGAMLGKVPEKVGKKAGEISATKRPSLSES